MNQLEYVRITSQGQTLKGVYNHENNQFLQIISGRNSFRCQLIQYTTKPNLEVIRNLTPEEETATGRVLMQYGTFYNLKNEQAILATKIQTQGESLAEKVRVLQNQLVRPKETTTPKHSEIRLSDIELILDNEGISNLLYLLDKNIIYLKDGTIILKKTQTGFPIKFKKNLARLLFENTNNNVLEWERLLVRLQEIGDVQEEPSMQETETSSQYNNATKPKESPLPEWHIDRIKLRLNNIGHVNLTKLLELRIVKEDENGILTHSFPAGFVTEEDFIQSLNEIQIPALDFTLLQGVMSFFNRFK